MKALKWIMVVAAVLLSMDVVDAQTLKNGVPNAMAGAKGRDRPSSYHHRHHYRPGRHLYHHRLRRHLHRGM